MKDLIAARQPWLTYAATEALTKDLVPPVRTAFEWGSGGSTLWLLSLGFTVTTVEHDPVWFRKVSAAVNNNPNFQGRWTGHLILPSLECKKLDKDYCARSIRAPGCFSEYAREVQKRSQTYDVVLVDGRARTQCLANAVAHTRKGSLVILDNSEREDYQAAMRRLPSSWVVRNFEGPGEGGSWRTTVWEVL